MKKMTAKFGWLFIALFLVSCASEPEAPVVEEPAAVEQEVEKVTEVIDTTEKSAEEIAAIVSKSSAGEARNRALSVKAQNAAKEIFASAQALYDQAEKDYTEKEFSLSKENFDESIPLFNDSHDEALAAKERALAALENAKKAIEEADAVVNAEAEAEVNSEQSATQE